MLGLVASIKNIELNIRDYIVQCLFYETRFKMLRLISKTYPNAILAAKCHCWFRKTNTV